MKLGMINGYDKASFEKIKKCGLEFVEVCCNFDEDNVRFIDSVESIKKNVAETGIPVGSVGRWNLAPNVGGKIVPEEIEKNIALMHAAAEVGSPVFVCGCNYDDSVSLYKNYVAAVDYFSQICEEAKKLDIIPAVYNCSWSNFVNSSKQWEVVLGEVPDLMIKYDCSHTFERGNDYIAELNKWLPRVAHMHVKGMIKVNGECVDAPPAGMDMIDWRTVFALIYKYNYNRGLSIEPHSETWCGELADPGVIFTINYIKQFILR